MSIDNDMKIVLGASLDTSEKSIKSISKEIKTLQESLKDKQLQLKVCLSNDASTIRDIKKSIDDLHRKISDKKIAINYKLNLSNENKTELNKVIDKLSAMKSVNPLKLRISIDTSKETISKLNKQIDTLSNKLNGITVKTSVNSDSLTDLNKDSSKSRSNKNSGDSSKDDSLSTSHLKEHKNLIKETEKTMGNLVTKTKQYQNSIKEIEKVTSVSKDGGLTESKTSVETTINYQKATNDLYKKQEQIEKEIVKWKNLKKNATDEELSRINEVVLLLEKQKLKNDKIINLEQLQNKELEEKVKRQRELADIQAQQKEKLRLDKIGQDTGFEDKNLFGNKDAIEEWAKSLHGAGSSVSNMKQRVKTLSDQQTQFTVSTKSSKGMVTEYTYAVDKASGRVLFMGDRVREAGRRQIDFANDLKIAINRLIEWNLATTLIQGSIQKFTEGVEFIKELDNQLTQVAVTTGQTRKEVQSLTEEYSNMANQTSKTVSEIAMVNTELIRQGLSQADSTERLETILQLSSVASMDVNSTLSVITSSVNALGESAERTADVLVYAGNISASSVDSIGTAMTKVASSAKVTETSIEQLAGMISALIDVTQESPETLGNSLKSIMSRFSKINELGEINEDLNDVQTAFESVGVAFTNSEGQIRPFYELLSDMGQKWTSLDRNTKAYIATMAAGTMQGNRFLALMENWSRVSDITTGIQENASGVLSESYEVWTSSIEAQINRLKIAWEELWLSIIESDSIIVFFKMLTSLVDGLGFAFDTLGTGGLVATVSFFAMASKIGVVSNVYKSLKDNIGLVGVAQSVLNSLFKISKTETEKLSASQTILNTIQSKLGISSGVAELGLRKFTLQAIKATTSTVALKVASIALTGGMSLLAGIFTNVLFSAITGSVSKFLDFRNGVSEASAETKRFIDTTKESIKSYEKTSTQLSNLSSEFNEYQKRIESGNESLKLNSDEQQRYNDALSKMSEISPDIISGYDERGEAIARYGTRMDEVIEKQEALIQLEKEKILANYDDVIVQISQKLKTINDEIQGIRFDLVGSDTSDESIQRYADGIKKLKEQLSEGTISDIELNVLKQMEQSYSQYLAKTKIVTSEYEEQRKILKEFINIDMERAFEGLDFTNQMRSDGEKLVIDVFTKAFEEDITTARQKAKDAMYTFAGIYEQMNDIMDDETPTSIDDNTDSLNELSNQLITLGVPTEEATNLIYQMAYQMQLAKGSCDELVISVSTLSDKFKTGYTEIQKIQGYLTKLAKGEALAGEELMSLIEKYPELEEYIARTGDLTLKNGEIFEEVFREKYSTILNDLNAQKMVFEEEKKMLSQKRGILESNLAIIKEQYDEGSKVYKQQKAELDEVIERESKLNQERANVETRAKAYEAMLKGFVDTGNTEALSDMYKEATENIVDYTEMLKDLQKNGISGDIIDSVMSEHLELIDVLDDESQMYERLKELILENEKTQKDAYKRMQQYSRSFWNDMLKGNADLFNQLAEMYELDLKNFSNVHQMKQTILSSIAISSYRNENDYLGIDTLEEVDAKIQSLQQSYNTASISQAQNIEEQIKHFQNLRDLILAENNALDDKIDSVDFDKVNTGTIKDKESNKRKNNIKLIELETDAYLKLVKAMREVERQMENNDKIMEYASGKDKIELLVKQNDLLTKQQKIVSNLANEYRKELSDLQTELSKTIGLNDGAMGINNYNSYVKQQQNELNKIIKQINATSDDDLTETLTSKKDALEEKMDKLMEDFERYLELRTELIPDLSDSWWEDAYAKFENTLQIMETDLSKYEKQVNKINSIMGYILQGRNDNSEVLQKEYELMKNISEIYENEIDAIQDKIDSNNIMVEKHERYLDSINDKNSDEYLIASRNLLLARYEQDKLAESLQSSLDEYASQQNAVIQKQIEMFDRLKETAIETFESMRNELDEFSSHEFNIELETIIGRLDKIDGIFMNNPEYTLSTSEARKDLDDLSSDIDDVYSKINSFKTLSDRISKATIKDGQSANKQREDMMDLIEEQIQYENELKGIYTQITEQLAEQKLEYERIEDALQNQIDSKQEELSQLKEQFETEQKITSMIEKRLALLKAMDDTRFNYITGQGESVFTYDISNVNALKQELGQQQRQDEQDAMIESIQNEINEMNENLSKTKEIHEQQLAILELQESKIGDLLDVLADSIDKNMGDNLDKIYENLTDVYIEDMQKELTSQTDYLKKIWETIESRETIESSGIKQEIDSDSNWNTKSMNHKVEKDETLESIASAYNTSISKLLKLNPNLKEGQTLKYGQDIKVPEKFDTGGYTGEFGNQGKLAVLHEKELVLNKQDTSNILQSVDIARSITKLIGNISTPSISEITNNSTTSNSHQIIENINVYGVNNVNDFSNEMQRLFRNSMGRLS